MKGKTDLSNRYADAAEESAHKFTTNDLPDYDFKETSPILLHGLAVVGKDNKYGYINRSGVEVTPLKYDRARSFGLYSARVQLHGKWGLVNNEGKEITPLVYDDMQGCDDPIVRLGNKFGYVSQKSGKLLTPIIYDCAETWVVASHCHLAAVQIAGKWGCINEKGKEILPLKYEEIDIHQLGVPGISAKYNDKWGYFNVHGKEIVPIIYEDIFINKHCIVANYDGQWGFMDKNGNPLTDFEYEDFEEFSNDRARVKKNGKYGFIDAQCAVVIPIMYDDCEPQFSETSSSNPRILPLWVKLGGLYGFIDIFGHIVIKPKYEFVQSFQDIWNRRPLAAVVKNGAAGFISITGKVVILCIYEPDFDQRENYCFLSGFANVKQGGKWGVIDQKNNIVIPFLYDEFLSGNGNNAGFRCAIRNGKKLVFDTKGNEWDYAKEVTARTFKEYLHAVSWADVAESFVSFLGQEKSSLKTYEENFNNFKSKTHKPSNDRIRIFANNDKSPDSHSPVSACMFSVENGCTYVFFNWEEILDMEVRIEDNLTLTDADVVAVTIWEAGDCYPMTKESINSFLYGLRSLDEQIEIDRKKSLNPV